MKDFRKLILLASLAVAMAVAGCSRVNVQLNAYRAARLDFPTPTADNTIAVVVGTDTEEPLLAEQVADKIILLLNDLGYKTAEQQQAEYLLSCWFSMDSGKTYTGVMPIYEPGGFATTHITDSRGRWRTVTTQLPGTTQYVPYSYTIFCKQLGLTLYDGQKFANADEDTLKDAIAWRCTALIADTNADIRWRINHLLIAAFDHLGQDTSRQINIKMDENDDRVNTLVEISSNSNINIDRR